MHTRADTQTIFRMDVQLTIRRNVKVSKITTEFRLDIQNFTNRNNPVVDYLNFNSYKVEFEDQLEFYRL